MAREQQPKPVQLCVFDTERDYPEGEEAQRILAYYPPDACSVDDQTSVIGFAQALLTFNANFEEVGRFELAFWCLQSEQEPSTLHRRKPVVIACMPNGMCGPSTDRRHTS